MITGWGSEMVAVEAMKLGATDYVVKEDTYAQMVPGLVREALVAGLRADPTAARPAPALEAAG